MSKYIDKNPAQPPKRWHRLVDLRGELLLAAIGLWIVCFVTEGAFIEFVNSLYDAPVLQQVLVFCWDIIGAINLLILVFVAVSTVFLKIFENRFQSHGGIVVVSLVLSMPMVGLILSAAHVASQRAADAYLEHTARIDREMDKLRSIRDVFRECRDTRSTRDVFDPRPFFVDWGDEVFDDSLDLADYPSTSKSVLMVWSHKRLEGTYNDGSKGLGTTLRLCFVDMTGPATMVVHFTERIPSAKIWGSGGIFDNKARADAKRLIEHLAQGLPLDEFAPREDRVRMSVNSKPN